MSTNFWELKVRWQTFPPIIWIFIESESDGIESRLPFLDIFYFTYLKFGGKLCAGESVVSLLASSLKYSRLSRPRNAKGCTCSSPHWLRSRWTSSWRPLKASSPTDEIGFDLNDRRIRYLQSATAGLGTEVNALPLRSRSTRLVRPLKMDGNHNNIDHYNAFFIRRVVRNFN